jgi:hypothetical protein
MADIGEITREIEVIPIEQPVEIPTPAPAVEPAEPAREEEPVPA